MKIFIITLFLVSCAYAADEKEPDYRVVSSLGNNVEIREYDVSKWACTNSTARMFQDSTMFWRLFGYIQGANNQNQKMPMTKPVLSWNVNNPDKKSTQLKVMCFYVPKEFHSNTPNPTSGDVSLKSLPKTVVATIKFGGFASSTDYATKKNELVRLLGADAKNYDSDMHLMAGYDSPYTFFDRRNEVWLKKLN